MKRILCFIALLLSSSYSNAALIVSKNGFDYELQVVSGIYSSHLNLLMEQPWWADAELAQSLANVVKYDLGRLNSRLQYGVAFAHSFYNGPGANFVTVFAHQKSSNKTIELNAGGTTWWFAHATSVTPTPSFTPVDEPSTLPIFLICVFLLSLSRYKALSVNAAIKIAKN